jgi:signal transduction histidine kinase
MVGYVLSAIIQIVVVSVDALLLRLFPSFAFAGLLALLVVALSALIWGAGPSLVATILGAVLLDVFALPPMFAWTMDTAGVGAGLVLFLITGITISLVATQIEQARAAREQALQEANERMDEFLGVVSHELKNPLTAISLTMQMSKRHLTRAANDLHALEQVRDVVIVDLEHAERQLHLQNRLVNDLLDVSRVRANRLELLMEQCDLVVIARSVVEDLCMVNPERTIHLDVSPDEIPVRADVERIGQVITNYLTNALKYSAADRPVVVSLRVQEQQARLSVRDEGPGLTEAEQKHIWQRFYRVKGIAVQSGEGAVGLGLGLHICAEIIIRHHGQVGVQSERGKGATFWFTLPLTHLENGAMDQTDSLH